MEPSADARCIDSRLGEALTSYCFGGLAEDERQQVEAHLLDCDACWEEFQRLDVAVRTLRVNQLVEPPGPAEEVVSLLGLSGRLDRAFGGHLRYVLAIASLYGLQWTASVWTELGYAYDRFGHLAWLLSLPVALWAAGALVAGLGGDVKATRAGRSTGFARSLATTLPALALLVVALMIALPAEPTILASFQTRTAAGGYLKNAILHFLPLLVFVIPTFHTVARLQRELRIGRHRPVERALADGTRRISPRGMPYLPPRLLMALLLVIGIVKIAGLNYLLDALEPGPYANLFAIASDISTALWFAVAIISMTWYQSSLNELKREAATLVLLERRSARGREH